jgi:hypothetical protein
VSTTNRVLCPIRPEGENGEGEAAAAAAGGAAGAAAVAEGVAAAEAEAEVGWQSEDEVHPAEEARKVKVVRDPSAPTKAERDAHEAIHLPFRVWCTDCINGRRDNPPHIRTPNAVIEVPEVLFDYCFVRRDDEEETITILLMKDRQSRAIRAWVAPHKGVDLDGTVERAVQGINELGHRGRVAIKTDNEPALVALRDALIAKLPEGAVPVSPPSGERRATAPSRTA